VDVSSWLCPTREDRERLLDMEPRLKPVRTATLAMLTATLVISGPWLGFWTLAPLACAVVAFAVIERFQARAARPELWIAGAYTVTQSMIALAVALSGGPESPGVPLLAIPVVSLSARFPARGVWAGTVLTAVLMLAVTVGIDPAAVADAPYLILFPLTLLASVAVLSTALMRSDLEHRSESVLDGLTGMLNRRALSARCAELDQQARLTGEPVGVILGDLDHFKRVNDEHGHARGDAVLVDVAYALRKQLRAFDLAYRVGGEEFLVLLPGASEEETLVLAERLRATVAATPLAGLDLTMSLGVASTGGLAQIEPTIARADAALYAAKRAGRDCVHSASAEHLLV
jgi:diguanylate cyclase (GGDEF)-like protein